MSQHNRTVPRVDGVLEFWFGELAGGFSKSSIRDRWFASDPAFDQEITRRFAPLIDEAAGGALTPWLDDPRGRLAFILVTDQFSRQIHRGSTRAFATDPLALAVARDGVERGDDERLAFDERVFFYLPFEHSESRVDQHTSVALFSRLCQAAPPGHLTWSMETLRFARQHRDIVLEFGRFPHRNAALGRESTEAEKEFLRHATRFGQ